MDHQAARKEGCSRISTRKFSDNSTCMLLQGSQLCGSDGFSRNNCITSRRCSVGIPCFLKSWHAIEVFRAPRKVSQLMCMYWYVFRMVSQNVALTTYPVWVRRCGLESGLGSHPDPIRSPSECRLMPRIHVVFRTDVQESADWLRNLGPQTVSVYKCRIMQE